jgi:hypothetical protein
MLLERHLDDLDGAGHTRTETAWRGKKNSQGWGHGITVPPVVAIDRPLRPAPVAGSRALYKHRRIFSIARADPSIAD